MSVQMGFSYVDATGALTPAGYDLLKRYEARIAELEAEKRTQTEIEAIVREVLTAEGLI